MKASLDEDQTDIVPFTKGESRSVENIADVAATQNAIPLIFQCHDPATIFIPNTIAETPLNVVPSGHHLKSHAVPSPDGALIETIRKLAPSVPSFSHSIQLLQKILRRWDWPAFLVMRKPSRPSASIEPIRRRTQRAFPKPRSTSPSCVNGNVRPAPLRSGFRNARSVLQVIYTFLV